MVDYRENGRKVDPSLFVFDVESSFSLDVINIEQTCPRDFSLETGPPRRKICEGKGRREDFSNDFHRSTLLQDRPQISAGTRWSDRGSITAGLGGRSPRPKRT